MLENYFHITAWDNGDIFPIADIIRRSFAPVAERFALNRENCPGNGAFISAERLGGILKDGARLFVLETGGATAGCVLVKRKNAAVWYLEKLAVLPEYRRRGYGRALVAHAQEYIKEAGGELISIGIIDAHTDLKRWYEKAGFRVAGSRDFASLPFTVCYMEKNLVPGNV